MMVVKEPHEMSESVKNYPEPQWSLQGMRPLQFALIFCVLVTSVAGILSNPLFTLANESVARTPMLQASPAVATQQVPVLQQAQVDEAPSTF
jgi:NAD(P)H-quinone oxidoreductase subunit 2